MQVVDRAALVAGLLLSDINDPGFCDLAAASVILNPDDLSKGVLFSLPTFRCEGRL